MNYIKSSLVFALILLSFNTFAQFGYGEPEEVTEVKKRQLLVMLEEEDPKKISALRKKPEELALYQSEIKRVNDILKEAVKYWTFSATVNFKSRSEIINLQKTKNNDYAVLSFTRYKVENWHSNMSSNPAARTSYYNGNTGVLTTSSSYWLGERYISGSREIASVYIDLIEDLEKGRPIYVQNLPNLFPTIGDIVFGIQMVQTYLEGRLSGKKRSEGMEELKEYANVLKTKILLLDKEDLKGNLKEEEISNSYPFKYLVTDYPTIEKAILEKNRDYAYVQIVPMTGTSGFVHLVVDAEKGVAIGYSSPIGIGIKGVSNGAERITHRHLKNYTRFIE